MMLLATMVFLLVGGLSLLGCSRNPSRPEGLGRDVRIESLSLKRAWLWASLVVVGVIGALVGDASPLTFAARAAVPHTAIDPAAGINNLDHLIFVVQENRSFDQLLRDVPRSGRHPEERVAAGSTCACPDPRGERDLPTAVPRHGRLRRGRPAQREPAVEDDGRTAVRMDGASSGRWWRKLLGVRAAIPAPRSHVRAVGLLDTACSSLLGLGLVRNVPRVSTTP